MERNKLIMLINDKLLAFSAFSSHFPGNILFIFSLWVFFSLRLENLFFAKKAKMSDIDPYLAIFEIATAETKTSFVQK